MDGAVIILIIGGIALALIAMRSAGRSRPSPGDRHRRTAADDDNVVRWRPEKRVFAPLPPKPVITGAAYVIDGDTIRINGIDIRLFGIDAPELNHPYGKVAKSAMLRLCKGHRIKAEIVCRDVHGRTVARCFLPDGRDLSAELVTAGLAIDWPKHSGGIYRSLEPADARKKMWLADARQKGRMDVWTKYADRRTQPT